ncbi:YciI family protein [Agromyces intestinalis]|uniref:YciI family protein n=2 Tax=Agromyces intestinalis TaxID=2592652 RepID=A0A5C1YJJ4_9MICO|nr:YciI family protein [Agromyces intestinalis]QEO16193.1 YciI family protein [Agromyces intestinalis]
MRYTLLLHYPELMAEGELDEAAIQEGQRAFQEYATALADAGVLIGADVLAPSSATTQVTRKAGELQVQDGPFADTREALGGRFLIDVADLDQALEWAAKAPSVTWGTVEVRPVGTWFDLDSRHWQVDPQAT